MPGLISAGAAQSMIAAAPATETVLAIFFGQSNGRAFQTTGSDVPTALAGPISGARIYNTDSAALETYEAGVNSDTENSGASTPQKWGPEASFAKDFKAANPSKQLVIVKATYDSTALAAGAGDDWSASSSGEYYDDLTGFIAAAKSALSLEGITATEQVAFFMQGEEDAESSSEANAYGSNLSALIDAARTDWGFEDMPFYLMRITASTAKSVSSTVRAFQAGVAELKDFAGAVDIDFLSIAVDGYHIEPAGVVDLGSDFFDAYSGNYPLIPARFGTLAADKNGSISLTAGNTTAEGGGTSSSSLQVVRSDKVPFSGKRYAEFLVEAQIANINVGIGYGISTSEYWGQDSNSVGYAASGQVFKGASVTATFASYGAGDRIMLAFDSDTGRVWFGKNGVWNGDPAAGTGQAATISTPTLSSGPRFGATLRRSGDRVQLVSMPSDWTYSPPTGFGQF